MLKYKKDGKSYQYYEGLFESGYDVLIADGVRVDMFIALTKCRYFYVEDIDKEFISDEVGDLYPYDALDSEILPEHTKLTFYDEAGNAIVEIPGNAPVIAWKRVKGSHLPV